MRWEVALAAVFLQLAYYFHFGSTPWGYHPILAGLCFALSLQYALEALAKEQ